MQATEGVSEGSIVPDPHCRSPTAWSWCRVGGGDVDLTGGPLQVCSEGGDAAHRGRRD